MRLIEGWWTFLRYAWSVRLVLLAGLLAGLELILPVFIDDMPRGWFVGLAIALNLVTPIVQVIAQKRIDG